MELAYENELFETLVDAPKECIYETAGSNISEISEISEKAPGLSHQKNPVFLASRSRFLIKIQPPEFDQSLARAPLWGGSK